MVVERLGANSDYRPLPLRGSRENETGSPLIKAQINEVSRQLQQLIPELQNLTREMRSLRADRHELWSSDPPQFRGDSYNGNNVSTKDGKIIATNKSIRILRRRGRQSVFIKGISILFIALGATASIIAALVLYFHGPDLF